MSVLAASGSSRRALEQQTAALFAQLFRQTQKLQPDRLRLDLEEKSRLGERVELAQIMLQEGLITRQQLIHVLQLQARWVATAMRGAIGSSAAPYPTFLSLCMPAYNEEANLENTLEAACTILPEFVERFEVVVVDDGSQDATSAVVEQFAKQAPTVRLVRHKQNRGYGAAVTSGLRAARGDLICFTDSDGQFSFLDLPWFLSQMRDQDVVVGYRYRRADPWHRRLNAKGWNWLIRLFLGVSVRDLDCAFKVFRRAVVARLQLTATGAAINAEIMSQCVRGGLRIRELPVAHYPRHAGAPTGAALRVIWKAFRELPRLWQYRVEPFALLDRPPIVTGEPGDAWLQPTENSVSLNEVGQALQPNGQTG